MQENQSEKSKEMNRRHFLKVFGGGAVASSAALCGCSSKQEQQSASGAVGEVPTDKMTHRKNPTTGDVVSLLGYGCMRWPLKKGEDG